MTLRTVSELYYLISSFNINGLVFNTDGETQYTISLPNDRELFSVRDNDIFVTCLRFSMSESAKTKYLSVTGKTHKDVVVDLLYHFFDNFQELSSFNTLRDRMRDPATSGAFATAIAVNKYIKANNSSPEEIKELLSGSKWRWKKTEGGDYVQQTLVSMYNGLYTTFHAQHAGFCPEDGALSSLIKGKEWLVMKVAAAEQERQRVLERVIQQQQESETKLKDYSDRATNYFSFKKGKTGKYSTFLGIELELEGHSTKEFKSLSSLKDHAIFKRDGSLDNGVEICTAPATLDVHKEAFAVFFKQMQDNKSSLKALSSCGLHVHIDRKKLSTLHIANLCLFLNNSANETQIAAIAGRPANRFCQITNHKYRDFLQGNSGDRYRRVNLTNSATVELRMFASTTKEEEFNIRLEFTQASVDYTRPGETSISCKALPKWEHFKMYVAKHKHTYPTLSKIL